MTRTIALLLGFATLIVLYSGAAADAGSLLYPARSPGTDCRGRAGAWVTAPLLGPALLCAHQRPLPPSLAMPGARRLWPVVFQLLIASERLQPAGSINRPAAVFFPLGRTSPANRRAGDLWRNER
jgi:hypothetical protein